MESEITSRKSTARLAGLLYLIWILTGLYGMFYIPSRIDLEGDAASSAQNVLSHEFLFRTSILNDLISSVIWVFMVFVFFRLFKSVDGRMSKLLVALVIVQIPVVLIAESFNITSLLILKGETINTFQLSQRQELAMLLLKINEYGAPAFEVYWGLWLLPLAILVYRSQFLPRFLGVWLAINGLAFLVLSITSLLLPQYKDVVFKVAFPAMLGEVAFMLWLLIKGAKSN
jgi:Domain of unknown function (DUF4386)